MNFNVTRLGRGERILALAALALFVFLFFFKWFGVTVPRLFSAFVSGAGYNTTFTGWHTLTGTRWVLLLAILAALALVVLVGSGKLEPPLSRSTMGALLTALGGLATVLVFRRTIVDHPGGSGVHVKLGGYLGLLACALLTYGGYVVMTDEDVVSEEDGVMSEEDAALVP
ncbi:MAG: hypothetical protein ACHQDY_07505 [Solirubrobacterales bacterium]